MVGAWTAIDERQGCGDYGRSPHWCAAAAEELAKRGHAVVLVARRAERLAAVAQRCGERSQVVVADVSRRDDVKRVVAEAVARWGRVDVWINNVGQGISRVPSELTDSDVTR